MNIISKFSLLFKERNWENVFNHATFLMDTIENYTKINYGALCRNLNKNFDKLSSGQIR